MDKADDGWKDVAGTMASERVKSNSVAVRLFIGLLTWLSLVIIGVVICIIRSAYHTVWNNLRVAAGFLKTVAVSLVLTIRRNK